MMLIIKELAVKMFTDDAEEKQWPDKRINIKIYGLTIRV